MPLPVIPVVVVVDNPGIFILPLLFVALRKFLLCSSCCSVVEVTDMVEHLLAERLLLLLLPFREPVG